MGWRFTSRPCRAALAARLEHVCRSRRLAVVATKYAAVTPAGRGAGDEGDWGGGGAGEAVSGLRQREYMPKAWQVGLKELWGLYDRQAGVLQPCCCRGSRAWRQDMAGPVLMALAGTAMDSTLPGQQALSTLPTSALQWVMPLQLPGRGAFKHTNALTLLLHPYDWLPVRAGRWSAGRWPTVHLTVVPPPLLPSSRTRSPTGCCCCPKGCGGGRQGRGPASLRAEARGRCR